MKQGLVIEFPKSDRLVMIIPYRYEVQSQGKMEGLATLTYILLGRWNGPGGTINVDFLKQE